MKVFLLLRKHGEKFNTLLNTYLEITENPNVGNRWDIIDPSKVPSMSLEKLRHFSMKK